MSVSSVVPPYCILVGKEFSYQIISLLIKFSMQYLFEKVEEIVVNLKPICSTWVSCLVNIRVDWFVFEPVISKTYSYIFVFRSTWFWVNWREKTSYFAPYPLSIVNSMIPSEEFTFGPHWAAPESEKVSIKLKEWNLFC